MVVKLEGKWKSGFAFDVHTLASVHLGFDEQGHSQYDTTRSEMGELVYQLKYKHDKAVVDDIIQLLDVFTGIEKFDFLIAVPATNKARPFQPVELITQELGKRRGVKVLIDLFINNGDQETKGISDPVERLARLQAAFHLTDRAKDIAGKSVLLVDDLYRSGSTLEVLTDLLYEHGKVQKVSVLTMTKTKSNR
jgi:competence protein ComFC